MCQNIGYITQPNSRTILQIDPDRMVLLSKATCNELNTTVLCVSAVSNTGRDYSGKISCFLGVNKNGGQNYIKYDEKYGYQSKNVHIAIIDTPTDICSDDYGHIYVSGQGSNNIHRLVKELPNTRITTRFEQNLKVLDIPLNTNHGIKESVALCFNQDCYSKLYIVKEWGKSVLVFDVI
ncbi:unnamed protein product [Mytilus coruscus]|uniref:Uncharacterized protein n=1 Tax=Mytilus coruscus TaxID=42192 RepID=A0A6J8CNK5_MYTCO|nr:unnamed protein product [Mytilus coruscus]